MCVRVSVSGDSATSKWAGVPTHPSPLLWESKMSDSDNPKEYISIKNWHKFQPKDSKSMPWIRDYKDKEADPDYHNLTILQRYMLDAICRLRGRYGRNLPNIPLWICRATAVLPRERHNATTAIQQLINSGFLIVTNQQDDSLGKVSTNVSKGEEEVLRPVREAHGNPPKPEQVLPKDSRHKRVQCLLMNAYREQTGAQCPWDGSDAKQLKSFLDSLPDWSDSQISQCLGNMYDSTGFAKSTRPRGYLPTLSKYLSGPLDEFGKAKRETYVNKGKQRQDASNDAIGAALARITGKAAGDFTGLAPLLGCDDRDSGSVFTGNGSARRGSGQTQAGGRNTQLHQQSENVPLNRGDKGASPKRNF